MNVFFQRVKQDNGNVTTSNFLQPVWSWWAACSWAAIVEVNGNWNSPYAHIITKFDFKKSSVKVIFNIICYEINFLL